MFADLVNDGELREDVDNYFKKKKIVLDTEGMTKKEEPASDEGLMGLTVVKDIITGRDG